MEIEKQKISIRELLSRYDAGERNFTRVIVDEFGDGLLRGVDLSDINLENSYLAIDFSGAVLRRANFRYTIWSIIVWEDVDFTGSDFTGINNGVGCYFIRCNLSNTIWTKADLWQSTFVECEEATAEFSDADFCEVEWESVLILLSTLPF